MNKYPLSPPSSLPLLNTALTILKPHFPQCLPLYRRLQFGRFYPSSYLITNLPLHSPSLSNDNGTEHPFVISFIDRSVRPETECWIYASGEHFPAQRESMGRVLRDFAGVVSGLRVPESVHGTERGVGGGNGFASHVGDERVMLFGAVGEGMRDMLREAGVMGDGVSDEMGAVANHVFVWDVEGFEGMSEELGEGLDWEEVRREDLSIVRSRTEIPRQESTLAGLPSLGIFDESGRIVAWAFVGLDASLTTLHVEEEFRGRGLAKKLTAKLFREKMDRFWEEGMPRVAHGNVIYGNEASRAMCKSLGGRDMGKCYWLRERPHA